MNYSSLLDPVICCVIAPTVQYNIEVDKKCQEISVNYIVLLEVSINSATLLYYINHSCVIPITAAVAVSIYSWNHLNIVLKVSANLFLTLVPGRQEHIEQKVLQQTSIKEWRKFLQLNQRYMHMVVSDRQ